MRGEAGFSVNAPHPFITHTFLLTYPRPYVSFRGSARNLEHLYQKPQPEYYVYILTNSSRTLYIGVTNDLVRRVYQHRQKLVEGFTKKYNVNWLVYYEQTQDVKAALFRERQIKAWRRSKKVELVDVMNPEWRDLSAGWYESC